MLILYDKNEKEFLSNGIGLLDNHVSDDVVSEEINGMFKLEFTYPMFSPYAKDLKVDNIVRATTPDSEQPFFITKTTNKDGYLTVTAYHIFYKLAWHLIEDINIVDRNSQAALSRILENTGFTAISNVQGIKSIRIVRYNAVEAILDSGKDNTFISRFGGEIKRDKYLVEFRARLGRTYESNPVEIRYAKNLETYDVEIDNTNVATRVMPIGFDGLLLPEKYVVKPGTDPNDYKTVTREYSYIKAIENSEEPKEDELPLEEAYQAMRNAVLSDFENGVFDAKTNYKITFQDLSKTEEYKNKAVLEKLYIGDDTRVIHDDEDIDIISRMISYRWSPTLEEYLEIELGNHQEKFSNIKTIIDSIGNKIKENQSFTQAEIDYVTSLLTSALGGHVLKKNGELLIMDTEDPNTATKVWRFNLNGFGYSGTGINGPYETAITMDGHILGKFIQVLKLSAFTADLGEVTAGLIRNTDGTSFWNLDTGEIVLNVKSLKILSKTVATTESVDGLDARVDSVETSILPASIVNTFITEFGKNDDKQISKGITKIDKYGVNVSVSSSGINSQLAYNGLEIKDGTKIVAVFGDTGAVIPTFEADEYDCPVIAGTINNSGTYNIGSSQTYPSVSYVLSTILKNRKILNNATLTFNIHGSLSEKIIISGFSGKGQIVLNFVNSAVLSGDVIVEDNSIKTFMNSIGTGTGLVKRTTTEPVVVNNAYLAITTINIDSINGGAGVLGSQGAFVKLHNVDFVNVQWAVLMTDGATARCRDTRGNVSSNGLVAQNGSVIHTWGTSPNGSSYEDSGTIHGTLNPTASTFNVPPVTAKTFTAVFGPSSLYTVNHDTSSVDSYYGATAAQGRYSGMSFWKDGIITFGANIFNYWQGGYNVLVEMRVRRKNSSHGSSAGVTPQAYNFSPSEAFNAIGQGGWSEWTTVPAAVFGSGGAALKFYNGNLNSGYAIFDAAEVRVTVTKDV